MKLSQFYFSVLTLPVALPAAEPALLELLSPPRRAWWCGRHGPFAAKGLAGADEDGVAVAAAVSLLVAV
jgi:hypothetical protein